MKRIILLATWIVLSLASCKKDKDNTDPSAITKENLSASYVLVSATAKYLGVDVDLMNNETLLPACKKDDVLTLKNDFTYAATDAGVTCTPNGSKSGTWSLPNTSTIILDNETLTILSFDGSNLKVSYQQDAPVPGGKVDVTATFKKQ